jgi:hypothetical protein
LALAAPSAANGGAFAALVIAQAVRMRMEERALTQAFPQYAAYAARTPRLVPQLSLLRTARPDGTPPLDVNWTHRSEPALSTLAEPTGPA